LPRTIRRASHPAPNCRAVLRNHRRGARPVAGAAISRNSFCTRARYSSAEGPKGARPWAAVPAGGHSAVGASTSAPMPSLGARRANPCRSEVCEANRPGARRRYGPCFRGTQVSDADIRHHPKGDCHECDSGPISIAELVSPGPSQQYGAGMTDSSRGPDGSGVYRRGGGEFIAADCLTRAVVAEITYWPSRGAQEGRCSDG
jgi:hypothetical protein